MQRGVVLILLLAVTVFGQTWPPGEVGPSVVIKGMKLFYGGLEFWLKAMCYNPAPLGMQDVFNGDQGGTGLCSVKYTAYGDYKSACYDSDFMNGSPATNREPPGPGGNTGKWFGGLWERDFPVMKELGVNTIRLYSANPVTQLAVRTRPEDFPAADQTLLPGNDHINFLDFAQLWDFKVIFPLYGDQAAILNSPQATMEQWIRDQIDEVGWHPAVIMYTYGNELPLNTNIELLESVNYYINYARNYQLTRWNRSIPITNAIVDLPSSYNLLFDLLDVDVFTTNNGYRGYSYTSFWEGDGGQHQGGGRLACTYNKPLFVGEVGNHVGDSYVNTSDWFPRIWKATYDAAAVYPLIGAAIFEYNNEPLKAATQRNMGVVDVQLRVWTENGVTLNSRTVNAWRPDRIVKNNSTTAFASYNFDIMAGNVVPTCGGGADCSVNLNTDPFTYWGRTRYSINDDFAWVCEQYGITEPDWGTYPPPATTGIWVPPTYDTNTIDGGSSAADGADGSDGADGGDGADGADGSDGASGDGGDGDGGDGDGDGEEGAALQVVASFVLIAASVFFF